MAISSSISCVFCPLHSLHPTSDARHYKGTGDAPAVSLTTLFFDTQMRSLDVQSFAYKVATWASNRQTLHTGI